MPGLQVNLQLTVALIKTRSKTYTNLTQIHNNYIVLPYPSVRTPLHPISNRTIGIANVDILEKNENNQTGNLNNVARGQPEALRVSNRPQSQRGAGDTDHAVLPDHPSSVPSASASVEDVGSVRSELSTVPGSYTGFASRPLPASTPSKQALPHGDGQTAAEDAYDSDSSGSARHGPSGVVLGNGVANSSSNIKLLRQNQRLLSEVERLVCELQAAKQREGELSLELESSQGQTTELQERVEELQSETEAQDNALRSAEQHLSESQRQMSEVQQELVSCQQQIQDMCTRLEEEKQARSSVEAQRDEAVQNFLEAQSALEDFQRRNHERMKKLEETEDHLRDSLAHTNAERDELLQKVDTLHSTVTAHEAEIERLQALSAMEEETKRDMESQNLDLRRQLAKLTTRLHKAEEDSLQVGSLRQENLALQSEVEDCRDAITQLEDMADQLRRQRVMHHASHLSSMADDSGNFSIHLGASMHTSAPSGKGRNSTKSGREAQGASEGNTNNSNGSAISNLLSELRSMMYEMDEEIRQLRSRLVSQEEDQQTMRDLRAELTVLMEKAVRGEEQTRDLEMVIGKLESEKASLARQLDQQKADLESRDTQVMTLEARLGQRNTQIIELQEDMNVRCETVARLEKELWKKSTTISSLEAKLEETQGEINDNASRLTQTQHDAVVLEDELKAVRKQVKSLQMDVERCKATEQQNQAMHAAQCRQYEKQIDLLQVEADGKDNHNRELQQMLQQSQQDAEEKERLIQQLETTLLESKQELKQAVQEGQDRLHALEGKLSHSSQQVEQLEAALLLCRSEIDQHLSSMERTRLKFDAELSTREQAIERLEQQLRGVQGEVAQKMEDNIQLERELAERRLSEQHCQSRIAHLEQSEASLKDKLKQLEQQLLKEKGQWMMEADELERKLGSQSADLDTALAKMSQLRQTIKELQEENQQTEGERASLNRALQNETATGKDQMARIVRLEKDLRDLRVELEQKIEMVGDLEDTVRNKDADLEQQRSLVEQLDIDKLRMQREMKQSEETRSQLEDTVQRLQFDGKAKEQILSDTREILRKTQGELSERSLEASELREAMEERQRELEERVATVQQLEHTIHETHNEMSQRMQRVDSTLHKYEAEIKERTGQIADLDDQLKQTQMELLETSRQLQQQQQLAQRQQLELHAATAKLEELDTTNSHQKQRLEEQKQENVEVTQELRLTREQLQTQHTEFLTARRELAASRRESERLARELEEVGAAQRCKDHDTARLSEELGAAQARAAQAEAKLSAHSKQHHRELSDMADRHREEMEGLRRSRDEAKEDHSKAVDKISQQSQQLSENERLYRQRLDSARSELEALHNELSSRKEVIRSANETIFMKDSEIARLKAQVSRFERHGHTSQLSQSSSGAYQGTGAGTAGLIPVLTSTLKEQVAGGNAAYKPHQSSASSHRYFLSSGPYTPLLRQDLSHNNANVASAQSSSELPMKDTWDDKDPQPSGQDYTTDHLVFSFERMAPNPGEVGGGGGGGGGGGRSGGLVDSAPLKAEEGGGLDSDTVTKGFGPGVATVMGKSDSNIKKAGGGKSGGGQNVSAKVPPSHGRSLSAPVVRSQPHNIKDKAARKKGKGNGKFPVKKTVASKGEKAEYSHHYHDPETLVSTYKSDSAHSLPQKEMEDLQQQLQANALRQQEIERQLRSLDDFNDSPAANDDLIDFSADQ